MSKTLEAAIMKALTGGKKIHRTTARVMAGKLVVGTLCGTPGHSAIDQPTVTCKTCRKRMKDRLKGTS